MRRVILATVSTIVGLIMLLSFKTHPLTTSLDTRPAAIGEPTTSPSTTATTVPAASSGTTGSTASTTPSTTATTTAPGKTVTVTGNAAQTRYGPVQVEVTVTNGEITAVQAVEYPETRARDVQINSRAIPRLNQEAMAAKSAKIDTVSGATYTSIGYITSLQSALDKAGAA